MIQFRAAHTAMDPRRSAPWTLGSGQRAALLLHGFGGTPVEMRFLGQHLAESGWTAHAPLLDGHGTTVYRFRESSWAGWVRSAQLSLEVLLQQNSTVALVGQSMGGLIALHLASRNPAVASVVALATPLRVEGWHSRAVPIARHIVPWYRPGGEIDLFNREAISDLYNYPVHSLAAVDQLMELAAQVRRDLPTIRQPVLIAYGGNDTLAPRHNGIELAARLLASARVERAEYPRSGHGISVDVDRDALNQRVSAWLQETAVPAGSGILDSTG